MDQMSPEQQEYFDETAKEVNEKYGNAFKQFFPQFLRQIAQDAFVGIYAVFLTGYFYGKQDEEIKQMENTFKDLNFKE